MGTSTTSTSVAASETPSEPVLVVRLREWVPEGPKQKTFLTSICNHYRKQIGESIKKVKQTMKKMDAERKYRVNNPGGTTLAAQMADIESAKKAAKKAEKE